AAQAAQQRQEALAAAERSRKELAAAVDARKHEEGRRKRLENERVDEERRLREAVAARTAEEARRLTAEEGRRQEEARLTAHRARPHRGRRPPRQDARADRRRAAGAPAQHHPARAAARAAGRLRR